MITIDELNKAYDEEKEAHYHDELSKLEFLCDYTFDITTYDSEISEHFARMMLEVLQALVDRKTFEYIVDNAQYLNYIAMVNMPWLKDKIEWGTSIRGAWIQDDAFEQSVKNILEWVRQ